MAVTPPGCSQRSQEVSTNNLLTSGLALCGPATDAGHIFQLPLRSLVRDAGTAPGRSLQGWVRRWYPTIRSPPIRSLLGVCPAPRWSSSDFLMYHHREPKLILPCSLAPARLLPQGTLHFFFSSALFCCRPEPFSRLGFGASSLTLALSLLRVHMGHRPSGHLAANSAKVFYDGVPWLPCQELRKRFFPVSLFPLPIITVAVFSVLLFLICKLSLTERAVQTL